MEGPVWPGRVEAILTAFAIYAAEQERAVSAVVEAFGSAGKGGAEKKIILPGQGEVDRR